MRCGSPVDPTFDGGPPERTSAAWRCPSSGALAPPLRGVQPFGCGLLYARILDTLAGFQFGGILILTNHLRCIGLLFLATAAWGQAGKPAPPPPPPKTTVGPSAAAGSTASAVAPGAAVITIVGLCEKPPVDKTKAADCKTIVTRAEFEQLVAAVAPTIAPPARKQLATQYGTALVMVHKAHEMGLDQGPKYQELMRIARIGVLTKELTQSLQEEAAHISDKEVDTYYHNNDAAFQEVDLQRIFIPRSKQLPESAEGKDKPADEATTQDSSRSPKPR